jgi:hypothetical protein
MGGLVPVRRDTASRHRSSDASCAAGENSEGPRSVESLAFREHDCPFGQPVPYRTRCRRHSEPLSDMATPTSFVISNVVAVLALIVSMRAQKRTASARPFITSVGVATTLVLLLLTSGCVSGFSPSGRPSGRWCDASTFNGGTMSATIDGTAWTAKRIAVLGGSTLEINASDCVHFLGLVIRGVTGLR